MNLRIHWVVGTAGLAAVCLLPLSLWWYGLDRASWVMNLSIATVSVGTLLVLVVKRINEACERAAQRPDLPDAGKLDEIPDDIFCPACSYNLHRAPGIKCPECGYSLANIRSGVCQIPWVRRREIGRLRGYWSTVWTVTIRNRRFCGEYARALAYVDARKFQWVTVLHAYLPALAFSVLVYVTTPPKSEVLDPIQQMMTTGFVRPGPTALDRAYAEVWPVAILDVCYLLFLAAATGVPSYFYHPRRISAQRQNTAIAMSYYACGPLALSVLPVAAVWAVLEHGTISSRYGRAMLLLAVLTVVTLVAAWYLNLVRIARRTMPQLKRRTFLVAVSLPCIWLALAAMLLVGLPFAILAVMVILASLS